MTFDPEVMMGILYNEVIRCQEEIKRLTLQAELTSKRQGQTAIEKLLHPEDTFTPTRNLRSSQDDHT